MSPQEREQNIGVVTTIPEEQTWEVSRDAGEPEAKPTIETVDQLINGLEAYQQTSKSLQLKHITIDPLAIADLRQRFAAPGARIEERIKKYRRSRPEIADPFRHVVAGQLIKLGVPRGSKVRDDARELLMRLYPYAVGEAPPEITEDVKKDILTEEFLTSTMERAAYGDEGSVSDQLDDPFRLVTLGLVIDPKDQEDFGFILPQSLLGVLKGLKHQESGKVLEEWIYQKLAEEPVHCIGFLRTLAQFTAFLDGEAYVRLYALGEGERKIPLLPFQSFHRAVRSAERYLSSLEGTDNFVRALKQIEELITLNFYQIIKGPLKNEVSALASEALAPSPNELAFTFTDWAMERAGNGHPSLQETARSGVIMVEQSGIGDVEAFCRTVADFDEKLGRAVTKEAIKLGLIIDTERALLPEIIIETLEALTTVWQDAKEIDFTKIIKPETEILKIYFAPGTYGPFCRGHDDFIRRLLAYIDHQEQLEISDRYIQRIILIAPITNVQGVWGYKKSEAQIGTISERVGSIMLHLADVDRKKVFITTALQPTPEKARHITRSIRDTANAFIAKVKRDFDRAGKVTGFQTMVVGCFGADEFQWAKRKDGLTLDDQQPKKVRRNCLGIGRYGFLIPTILSGDRFAKLTAAEALVLTPGTPMTSSTEAIKNLQAGDLSRFHASAVPYIREHWNRTAIRRRKKIRPQETEIPSVSEIYQEVIKEFEELIRREGLV